MILRKVKIWTSNITLNLIPAVLSIPLYFISMINFPFSDLKKLEVTLKKYVPKKPNYGKEAEFREEIYAYLIKLFKERIQKRSTRKRNGARTEDILFDKYYPIEVKINFSTRTRNQLATQIPDYVNDKKHIWLESLTFCEKMYAQLITIHLFLVIHRIKNRPAWSQFNKERHGDSFGGRVHKIIY